MAGSAVMFSWFGTRPREAPPRSAPGPGIIAEPSPPPEVVDAGGCPFEGCQLGEWKALDAVVIYQAPGGPATGRLLKGETVTATFAEVRATPRKAVVTNTHSTDSAQGLRAGNVVYVLYPTGEGAVAVWHDGRITRGSLNLTFDYQEPLESRPLRWTWWVRVQRSNGTTGWLKDPQGHFDGMDALA